MHWIIFYLKNNKGLELYYIMTEEKKSQGVDTELPEEFALRDEVRWLKSEDMMLFRTLRETMNKIEPAYIRCV